LGLWSLGRSKLLLVFGLGSGLVLTSSLDILFGWEVEEVEEVDSLR